jgi:peptidoglycan/xylan/chitin deacetylase (PgdA/CDA1 family)
LTFALTGCDSHPVLLGRQPNPSAARGVIKGPDSTTEPGAATPGQMPVVINHGPRNVNTVALTFDADMTPAMLANLDSGKVQSYANIKVLEILDKREVPATFFITGMWAERYAEVAARIAHEDRYEIANHTYRHSAYVPNCHGLPLLAPSQRTRDPKRTFDILSRFRGHQTRYFRFPGLCHDAAALKALAPLGVTVIDGDCVSGDPFAMSAAPIVHRVLSTVQPGSIIIMHITEANAHYTDQALGPILDGLAARGLRPVRLSELLGGRQR